MVSVKTLLRLVSYSVLFTSCAYKWYNIETHGDHAAYNRIVRGYYPFPAYHVLINRSKERDMIASMITDNPDAGAYYLISGPHGCGKSQLVLEAVQELQKERKGVIYLQIFGLESFTGQFSKTLGFEDPKLYTVPTEEKVKKLLYICHICHKLQSLGKRFRSEFNMPVLIVIDDVDKLVKSEIQKGVVAMTSTKLLDTLQDCAKDLGNANGNANVVRFVFVDSEGFARRRLVQRTGRMTRMQEIYVPDVTEDQARQFLGGFLNGTSISVNKTYRELTGGRIILLHQVKDLVEIMGVKSYDELYSMVINGVKFSTLGPCGLNLREDDFAYVPHIIKMRHHVITELFKHGGQMKTEDLTRLLRLQDSAVKEDILDILIKQDLLLFRERGTVVEFHSVAVKTALVSLGY